MALRTPAKLATQTLQCRAWQHSWEHQVTYRIEEGRSKYFELHLVCSRCSCTREDLLDSHGRVNKRNYGYPEGYLVKDIRGLGGRVKFNNDTRLTLVGRLARVDNRG